MYIGIWYDKLIYPFSGCMYMLYTYYRYICPPDTLDGCKRMILNKIWKCGSIVYIVDLYFAFDIQNKLNALMPTLYETTGSLSYEVIDY